MRTVTARDLQNKVKEYVDASQSERVVITGNPLRCWWGLRGAIARVVLQSSPGFWKLIQEKKRATHDFSAGIEIPADETQALALGHFDVLRILKTCKFPSESDLEPLNIELLNRRRH